jgi:polysaccharide export outer membrane protein
MPVFNPYYEKVSRSMPRLKQLLQPILIILLMAALASCGTTPPAATTSKTAANEAGVNVADKSAPGANTPAPEAGTAPAAVAQDTVSHDTYVIQPGDILTISVWKEKDLEGEYAVRPDGGLNFPLAGDIIVAGKTIEQIQVDIAAKLTKYVPDPVVTASVKQSQGNKIYVVGKVNKPGEFASNRTIDVMQALSMAGGPNPYAAVNKIKIIRRVNGEQKIFYFKYSRVEKGEDLEQNIILQGGDIVVVP